MGRKSRMKGIGYEREVCRQLKDEVGIDAKRVLEYQGGDVGCDVETDDSYPALAIQCKAGARPPVWAAMKQVEMSRIAKQGGVLPLAFCRKTNGPGKPREEIVAMRPSTFYWLLSRAVSHVRHLAQLAENGENDD